MFNSKCDKKVKKWGNWTHLRVNIQKEIPSGKFDPTGMESYKKLAKKFRTRQAKRCPQGEFGKTICRRRQLATIAKMI